MQPLADFELVRPTRLADAVALLAGDDGACPIAGGTDLLPNLRRGLGAPARLVDLGAVGDDGFTAIASTPTHWRIGAGVTLAALASHTALAAALPALAQAAASVAGPGHRSAATLGGNLCQDTRCVFYNQSAWWREANGWCLKRGGTVCHVAPQGTRCHAAFEGDVAPAAIALDADAEVAGPGGTRRLPLAALYRDDGAAHLALARGELLVALQLPRPAPGSTSAYRKQRVRGAMDFPLAGVAMRLRRSADGRLAELAVAIGGTNSSPFLLDGTAAFVGRAVDDALVAELGKQVSRQASPMRSTVTPAHHRRRVAVMAAERLLRELWAR
jgi:4-hydroxybenzoyl-CoA reductase subunit beta